MPEGFRPRCDVMACIECIVSNCIISNHTQTAPYLETVLQVLLPELCLSTYQPRKGTREAFSKADTDAITNELTKVQEQAEAARAQEQELTSQVSHNRRLYAYC